MKKLFSELLLLLMLCFIFANLFSSDTGRDYIIHADKALINQLYQNAIDHYLKAINYISEKEKSLVLDDIGYAYLQLKEFDKALIYLKQAVSSNPDDLNPHLYLAATYYTSGKMEAAYEEILFIDSHVHFDPSWIEQLEANKVKNRYGDEVSKQSILRMNKEKGLYINNEGNSNSGIKSQTIYIDAFNEDNEGVFYYLSGLILRHKEQAEKAEENFQKSRAAGYQPHAKELSALISDIKHKLKDHTHPESWYLYQQHLNELEKGMISTAINTLKKAFCFDERSLYLNHNLALLNFDLFQSNPNHKEFLEQAEYYCARSLWFSETLETDIEILTGCYDLIGNIYSQKKQYSKALEEFKSILSLDKKNPSAHYNLGCIYYIQNTRSKAESEWKQVIEFEKSKQTKPRKSGSDSKLTYRYIVPKKSFTFLAYSALGKLYFETGKQKQAKEEFSKAVRLNPDQPESYLYLSKIHRSQNMLELARHNLKQYLYLGGEKTKEVAGMITELNIQ